MLPAFALLLFANPCAACHPAQARHYPRNAMYRALEPVESCTILKQNPKLTFQSDGYSYEILNGIYKVTDGRDTIQVPIRYAFGLGAAGQTYAFQRNGRWYESRVSFYSKINGLDLTMGALGIKPKNLDEAAGRLMDAEDVAQCFGCHSTGGVKGVKVNFEQMTAGVQCESCHGPAGAHAEAAKAGKLEQVPKKLARLSTDEISDLCGSCHRTWSYISMNGPHGLLNVRFQPYRLTNSRCYDANDSRVSCVACHDPHGPLISESKAYDSKCTACHNPKQRAAKICRQAKTDCVSCHMPKLDLPGAHHAFTDHQIRIVRANEPYPN